MKAIKIYTQDSKYFMEDLDNDTTTELTEFVDDGKTLKLPENSANRSYCSVAKAIKGTVLNYKETKALNESVKSATSPKKSKVDLSEYYTDEEKCRIEELQNEINKINEAAAVRAKVKAEQEVLKNALKALDPDTLKALLKSLNA